MTIEGAQSTRRRARRDPRRSPLLASLLALGFLTTGAVASADDHGRDDEDRGAAYGVLKRSDVVLYELTERAQFTPTNHRVATADLEGTADRGTPLCPHGLLAYARAFFAAIGIAVKDAPRCSVLVFGQSDLDLATFSGTVRGEFHVVVNSDATNLVDGAELVVMAGEFHGVIQVRDPNGLTIDVLPGAVVTPTSVLPGFPSGLPPQARFSGKFRLPFKHDDTVVYRTDGGGSARVRRHEHALGKPTVRLDITFDPSVHTRAADDDSRRE